MRWVLVLLGVALSSSATAKPARERISPDERNCIEAKEWDKLTRCLQKQSYQVTTLYDLESARLVRASNSASPRHASLWLYVQQDGRWRRGNLFASITDTSEVLAFERTSERPGFRLDVGFVVKTSQLENGVSRPVVLMRKQTTACDADGARCASVITSCDAYLGGKAIATFRGKLVWSGVSIKVSGDATFSGKLCRPFRSQHIDTSE